MMVCLILTCLISFLFGFFWIYYPVFENIHSPNLIIRASEHNANSGTVDEEEKSILKKDQSDINVGENRAEVGSDLAFLTDFRLEREKERSRLQERLEELLAQARLMADEENAKTIHNRLMELAKRTALEKEVENLLKARGYLDVVAVVHEDSITVVIRGKHLNSETVSVIGELVGEITGYPLDQIRIVE